MFIQELVIISSSSSSNSSDNIKIGDKGKKIDDDINSEEEIEKIKRIKVPSIDINYQQKARDIIGKLLLGSKFLHEGLLIKTKKGNYYAILFLFLSFLLFFSLFPLYLILSYLHLFLHRIYFLHILNRLYIFHLLIQIFLMHFLLIIVH